MALDGVTYTSSMQQQSVRLGYLKRFNNQNNKTKKSLYSLSKVTIYSDV